MKKPDPRALQLACVRCGLNVEIFPTEHRHLCKHCGTLLVVDRLGGTVKLTIYHGSDIALTDPTVYDPNDETSCARKELFTADAKRHQSAQHWEAFRQNRVNEWNAKNDLAKFGVRKLMR